MREEPWFVSLPTPANACSGAARRRAFPYAECSFASDGIDYGKISAA